MQSTEIHSGRSLDAIFQMAIGFWMSKTLMTAVELKVFTKLSGNQLVSLEQMRSDILVMEQHPTEVFVTALVSLGLLTLSHVYESI